MLVNYLKKDTTDIRQFVSLQAILQEIIEPAHYIFPLLSWSVYAKDEKKFPHRKRMLYGQREINQQV